MTAFALPAGVEATAPPTVRDGVRLLVAQARTAFGPPEDATPSARSASAAQQGVEHTSFEHLGEFLSPGDLVVINTSATLAAAVDGIRDDGRDVTVHFATALDDGDWVVEVRPRRGAAGPVPDSRPGQTITLPDGVELAVREAHPRGQARLWRAGIAVDAGVSAFLQRHGRPIRYSYVPRDYPLAEYQTVFGREPGSAEMPSAGRPFTTKLITDLVTRGIGVAPITLHTGVSSQDVGEPPQPERFRVPESTARQVNMTRAWGGRIIAVGTTVTRALESALDRIGAVRARDGWTDLVLGPDHPAVVVRGLVTGWHAPGASHLKLLEAVAGRDLVDRAYAEAVHARYLWHEFGDSCLLLP